MPETSEQISHEELGRRLTDHALAAWCDWMLIPDPRADWKHTMTVGASDPNKDVHVTITIARA